MSEEVKGKEGADKELGTGAMIHLADVEGGGVAISFSASFSKTFESMPHHTIEEAMDLAQTPAESLGVMALAYITKTIDAINSELEKKGRG